MVIIDLVNENAIEIGSTYEATFQMCNTPDLLLYQGYSQIRINSTTTAVILTPTVQILSKDIFLLKIPYTAYPAALQPGIYQYDVLFSKPDDRFYAVGGKAQILKRITQIS